MDEQTTDDVADRLDRRRDSTLDQIAALRADFESMVAASRDSNADDEHDPEGSTIAFERSQLDSLVRRARRHLDEIDAAIRRLSDGTYGTCERCAGPIPPGRLEAQPTARTCVACASA